MLHGREMTLPSMQSLRAKLPTDVRDSEHGPRLENLKSRLRTAYEVAREQGSGHTRQINAITTNTQNTASLKLETRFISIIRQSRRVSQPSSDDRGKAHGELLNRSPD